MFRKHRYSIWTLLHLHDSYQHGSMAENLTDTEDGATVPRTFKATSKNIHRGSGQQKQWSKWKKSKKDTSLGKQVATFESIKKNYPSTLSLVRKNISPLFSFRFFFFTSTVFHCRLISMTNELSHVKSALSFKTFKCGI